MALTADDETEEAAGSHIERVECYLGMLEYEEKRWCEGSEDNGLRSVYLYTHPTHVVT